MSRQGGQSLLMFILKRIDALFSSWMNMPAYCHNYRPSVASFTRLGSSIQIRVKCKRIMQIAFSGQSAWQKIPNKNKTKPWSRGGKNPARARDDSSNVRGARFEVERVLTCALSARHRGLNLNTSVETVSSKQNESPNPDRKSHTWFTHGSQFQNSMAFPIDW